MKGDNSIGKPNQDQLRFIHDIQRELNKMENERDDYKGVCYMLDGPGGNGKTFCLETLYAYWYTKFVLVFMMIILIDKFGFLVFE